MTKSIHALCFAALTLFFASSISAQTFMSEEELMQTMVGKTITGLSSKDNTTPWTQKIMPHKKGKPKGKIDGVFGGDPYTSKWKIKKGKWCEDWGSGSACWQMEKVGDNQIQAYKGGEKLSQVWTVSDQ